MNLVIWNVDGSAIYRSMVLEGPFCSVFSNRCMNGRMHQGQEKCAEAKVSILGGHTVEDLEPKYGLAVIGGQSKSAEHAFCFASLT